MADMIVAGAGTTAVNGTYTENGTSNGKPLYQMGNYIIFWYGFFCWAVSGSNQTTIYYLSFDDVATPDLCTTWVKDSAGANPTPTVTAASSSQSLTLTCSAGSYSQTGSSVTLTHTPASQNLTLSCNAGSYALTGTNADLTVKRNYTLTCGAGSYSLTGTNADITSSRTLICEPASGGAYPDIIVSGAGSTAYNGTYAVYGARDGKPRYRKTTPESASGYAYLVWVDDGEGILQWHISQFGEDAHTDTQIMLSGLYYSNNDVATPDLVTTWVAFQGTLPVPTVAAGTSLGYILTGSDVTLTYTQGAQSYTLTCEAGSYTLTGTDISFGNTKSYELVCVAGSYALTGSSVSFVIQRNYSLTCEAGSYAVTGSDITLAVQRHFTLALGVGTYAITGTNAALTSARSLGCVQGSYTLTGLEADLFKGLVMPCGAGSYALTGTDASLTSHRIFALGMGSYVLVGTNAGLFILSPTPACRTYTIDAEGRLYTIAGDNREFDILAENRTYAVLQCTDDD